MKQKQKAMRKDVMNEGILILGLGFLLCAHFMGLCINGLCSPDWVTKNLLLSIAVELVLCYSLYHYIYDSAVAVFRETKSIDEVISVFIRVRMYAIFGVFYSFAIWAFPGNIVEETIKGTMLTSSNLLIISISVIILTSITISNLRKRKMRKWMWNFEKFNQTWCVQCLVFFNLIIIFHFLKIILLK